MNLEQTALCLSELGNETRLRIFRYLVKHGNEEIIVGDLQKEFDIPNSTLSHHISRLVKVGLVNQKRQGRLLICTAELNQLEQVVQVLLDECCGGIPCIQSTKSCC
ncbi:MAG: helix-turn-helix domain-containing protein [Lentisphaeria bacterium]|nr:helix-turn-helix domain-containing protein [Lentisphaeria bacterium]